MGEMSRSSERSGSAGSAGLAGLSGMYPAELRERAVRLVAESASDHESEWAAMKSVATKLGIGSAETVRQWVAGGRGGCRAAAGDDEPGVGRIEAASG